MVMGICLPFDFNAQLQLSIHLPLHFKAQLVLSLQVTIKDLCVVWVATSILQARTLVQFCFTRRHL